MLLFKSLTVTLVSGHEIVDVEFQIDCVIVYYVVGKKLRSFIVSTATVQEDRTSISNEKLVPEPITVIE